MRKQYEQQTATRKKDYDAAQHTFAGRLHASLKSTSERELEYKAKLEALQARYDQFSKAVHENFTKLETMHMELKVSSEKKIASLEKELATFRAEKYELYRNQMGKQMENIMAVQAGQMKQAHAAQHIGHTQRSQADCLSPRETVLQVKDSSSHPAAWSHAKHSSVGFRLLQSDERTLLSDLLPPPLTLWLATGCPLAPAPSAPVIIAIYSRLEEELATFRDEKEALDKEELEKLRAETARKVKRLEAGFCIYLLLPTRPLK
ncbi:hypothetical protein QBC38DRAFT_447416 [Podospora fimiseda]|uniref:Uncharacterized protein n=1 Tax=Podospora fimiseda TaxID=252190 RepID=A0AAN7BHK0_9PEZI|nr:hypothetical protein QBC38DRAFT_447416 [Podospora fimiseda]